MTSALAQFRSYDRSVRLLMVNQFTINLGFYMLMPYLAQHLSGGLGLAGWLVGLVLGVRNFSQQGMFLIGGTLADRFGYKPLIVAGLLLRTAGFATLGLAGSVPALIVGSAATGFAGALFNPAVRAYLAQDAGERRIEAFALFNAFYQAGILLGPLVGMALAGAGFRLTCLVAAGVFAVLGLVQVRALPARRGETGGGPRPGVLAEWRGILANRRFLVFAVAMSGSYVLSFQVYLALPLEARRVGGPGAAGTVATALLFVASGLSTVLFQTRVTAWCRRRLRPDQALAGGVLCMAAAFLPMLAAAAVPVPGGGPGRWALAAVPAALSALLLAFGTMAAYPFEMDTVVRLAGERLVATHYGLYNTVCGIGITLGNLLTGAALDAARGAGLAALTWIALVLLGVGCAWGLRPGLRAGGGVPAGAREAAS
ncbi:MFS transporter [Streptomyces bambusae]|uniref:MFS transporter n=1 Tax=Streptomyces bambusae TaxID=1550616 RepID=UPI001CFCDB00|nr:MFS transporter [Streptomyces bambusae]MCB5164330.1 MFS transporter [Streptomyces bambusae]